MLPVNSSLPTIVASEDEAGRVCDGEFASSLKRTKTGWWLIWRSRLLDTRSCTGWDWAVMAVTQNSSWLEETGLSIHSSTADLTRKTCQPSNGTPLVWRASISRFFNPITWYTRIYIEQNSKIKTCKIDSPHCILIYRIYSTESMDSFRKTYLMRLKAVALHNVKVKLCFQHRFFLADSGYVKIEIIPSTGF